ncbi:unnamed protein product, partial [Adineta steineri]
MTSNNSKGNNQQEEHIYEEQPYYSNERSMLSRQSIVGPYQRTSE